MRSQNKQNIKYMKFQSFRTSITSQCCDTRVKKIRVLKSPENTWENQLICKLYQQTSLQKFTQVLISNLLSSTSKYVKMQYHEGTGSNFIMRAQL